LDSATFLREEKSSTPAAISDPEKKRKTLEYKTLEMAAPAMEDSQSTNTQSTYFMQQQFQNNNTSATRSVYRRSATPWEQKKMDESVQYYQTMLPNSFEAHFYSYLAGHFNPQLFPELQQAAILQPTNTEVRKNVAAHYIVTKHKSRQCDYQNDRRFHNCAGTTGLFKQFAGFLRSKQYACLTRV
jgi:hypothetical protein